MTSDLIFDVSPRSPRCVSFACRAPFEACEPGRQSSSPGCLPSRRVACMLCRHRVVTTIGTFVFFLDISSREDDRRDGRAGLVRFPFFAPPSSVRSRRILPPVLLPLSAPAARPFAPLPCPPPFLPAAPPSSSLLLRLSARRRDGEIRQAGEDRRGSDEHHNSALRTQSGGACLLTELHMRRCDSTRSALGWLWIAAARSSRRGC